MQFLTTATLLATLATTALTAPAASAIEEVSITNFSAEHVPHGEFSVVDFYIMGPFASSPKIHCHHEMPSKTTNGLATFSDAKCDEQFSFSLTKNAEKDFVLTIDDRDLEGSRTFGKGSYFTTDHGSFSWEYIKTKKDFNLELK